MARYVLNTAAIRRLREAKRFSQTDMAVRMGYSVGHVSNVIRNQPKGLKDVPRSESARHMTLDFLMKMTRALNCKVEDIVHLLK